MGRAKLVDVKVLRRRFDRIEGMERGRDQPARLRQMRLRLARRLRELGQPVTIQRKNALERILQTLGDQALPTTTISYRANCAGHTVRDFVRSGALVVVGMTEPRRVWCAGRRGYVIAAAEHAHKFRKKG